MSSFLEKRFSDDGEPSETKHKSNLKKKIKDDDDFKVAADDSEDIDDFDLEDRELYNDSKPDEENNENQDNPQEESLLSARMNHSGNDADEENDDDFERFDSGGDKYGGKLSEEDVKDLEGLEDLMSDELRIKEEKRNLRMQRISQSVITVICVYLIILIFGAVITEYHYGDSGMVEPVVLSVSQIEEKNEFTSLASLYLQARSLYEDILVLDYRVAQNNSDLMSIAPEYEEALDTVSTLATAIEGADLLSKYNQVSSMLLEWVQTHLAAYCQYMSAAIAQNNDEAATEAIAARTVVYSDFQLITENMINLGEEVVYDLDDIKSWSPESYVEEATGGIVR